MSIDDMQFGFMPSKREEPNKEEAVLCFCGFGEGICLVPPREVVRWALRKFGVDKWLICIVMTLYTEAYTVVRTYAGLSESL